MLIKNYRFTFIDGFRYRSIVSDSGIDTALHLRLHIQICIVGYTDTDLQKQICIVRYTDTDLQIQIYIMQITDLQTYVHPIPWLYDSRVSATNTDTNQN
jgi:hypothetical protein